jgi:hypothetical protein
MAVHASFSESQFNSCSCMEEAVSTGLNTHVVVICLDRYRNTAGGLL